jgi:hypothetical protein
MEWTRPSQKPRSLIAMRTDQRFRIGARNERSRSSADAMPSLPPEIAKISVISTLKSKIGELNERHAGRADQLAIAQRSLSKHERWGRGAC